MCTDLFCQLRLCSLLSAVQLERETIGQSLNDFVHDFGAPKHLTFDGYSAQKGNKTDFMKRLRHYDIPYHISAPRRPNENPVEGSIRELKRRFYRVKTAKNVSDRLWDFLMALRACNWKQLSV